MLSLLSLAASLLAPAALAETPTVLPGGSTVLYGGLGANHFDQLQFRGDAAGAQVAVAIGAVSGSHDKVVEVGALNTFEVNQDIPGAGNLIA